MVLQYGYSQSVKPVLWEKVGHNGEINFLFAIYILLSGLPPTLRSAWVWAETPLALLVDVFKTPPKKMLKTTILGVAMMMMMMTGLLIVNVRNVTRIHLGDPKMQR